MSIGGIVKAGYVVQFSGNSCDIKRVETVVLSDVFWLFKVEHASRFASTDSPRAVHILTIHRRSGTMRSLNRSHFSNRQFPSFHLWFLKICWGDPASPYARSVQLSRLRLLGKKCRCSGATGWLASCIKLVCPRVHGAKATIFCPKRDANSIHFAVCQWSKNRTSAKALFTSDFMERSLILLTYRSEDNKSGFTAPLN